MAAIAALAAGVISDSIALIGFGLNGIKDSISAVIFLRHQKEREQEEVNSVGTGKALFAAGIVFF